MTVQYSLIKELKCNLSVKTGNSGPKFSQNFRYVRKINRKKRKRLPTRINLFQDSSPQHICDARENFRM